MKNFFKILKFDAQKLVRLRNCAVSAVCVILILLGFVWAAHFFMRHHNYEVTNDAYVDQYIVPVSVRVSGYIKEVGFKEHQNVKKGDTLLVLDDREFKIKVEDAKAALLDAEAGAEILEAEIEVAKGNIDVAQADIEEAKAKHVHLEGDVRRYAELIKKNAISGSIKEQADSDLASNAARIRSLEAQKETYVAQLATLVSKRKSAQALILMKKAALDIAMLDLEYTRICAPYDGYIGRRTIEPGEFVQAGQTIANFTDGKNKWVTANYKETQIASIREGQKVIIHVDAFPGETFNGTVSAISGATGSKYSLIPTDNSAGNFVKIRQRIPVRIEFDGVSGEALEKLRAGMMVEVDAEK